jgi:hypothetical protein
MVAALPFTPPSESPCCYCLIHGAFLTRPRRPAGRVSLLNVVAELERLGFGPLEPGPLIVLSIPFNTMLQSATVAEIKVSSSSEFAQ